MLLVLDKIKYPKIEMIGVQESKRFLHAFIDRYLVRRGGCTVRVNDITGKHF